MNELQQKLITKALHKSTPEPEAINSFLKLRQSFIKSNSSYSPDSGHSSKSSQPSNSQKSHSKYKETPDSYFIIYEFEDKEAAILFVRYAKSYANSVKNLKFIIEHHKFLRIDDTVFIRIYGTASEVHEAKININQMRINAINEEIQNKKEKRKFLIRKRINRTLFVVSTILSIDLSLFVFSLF